VLGKVRAKQDQHGDPPDQRISVLPMLMHGDAAFADRAWWRNASACPTERLPHRRLAAFIVNNQIGFTTYPRIRVPRPIRPMWRR